MIHLKKTTTLHSRNTGNAKTEERQIIKNAGFLCSRIVLLILLFFLFFFLHPVSIYLFTAFAFFPSIFDWLFSRNAPAEKPIILESCAKKYHFTYHHYIGEKYTGIFIIFSLILWQYILLTEGSANSLFQKAPAVCMFFYLLTKFISMEIIKKQINKYYKELECLDIP